jgi:hypothetical protein
MATAAYINKGSAVLAGGEAGAGVAWSMEGVTNGNGRVAAQYDLGAIPRAAMIEWSCEVQFQATPTQGKGIELYVAFAPDHDSTQIDGDVGATDAALGDVDMRRNLTFIGYVVSENAAASEKCVASGRFMATHRYVSFVGYNDSGATINATDTNFRFDFRLVYWEGQ